MTAILTGFQHQQPDFWEQVANFSLAPLRSALGVEYTVTNNTFLELPMHSLIWRIFCGVVAVTIALPFTIIGAISILLSSSHDKIWRTYSSARANNQSNAIVDLQKQQEIIDYFEINKTVLEAEITAIRSNLAQPDWAEQLPEIWNGLQGDVLLKAVLIYINFFMLAAVTEALANSSADMLARLAQSYPTRDAFASRAVILDAVLAILDEDSSKVALVDNFLNSLNLNDDELKMHLMQKLSSEYWSLLLQHDTVFCAKLMDSMASSAALHWVSKRCDLYVRQNQGSLVEYCNGGSSARLDKLPMEEWLKSLPTHFPQLQQEELAKAIFVYTFTNPQQIAAQIAALSLEKIQELAKLNYVLYPQVLNIPFNLFFIDFLSGVFVSEQEINNPQLDASMKDKHIKLNQQNAQRIMEFLSQLPNANDEAIGRRLLILFREWDWHCLVNAANNNHSWLASFVSTVEKLQDLDQEQRQNLEALKKILASHSGNS